MTGPVPTQLRRRGFKHRSVLSLVLSSNNPFAATSVTFYNVSPPVLRFVVVFSHCVLKRTEPFSASVREEACSFRLGVGLHWGPV